MQNHVRCWKYKSCLGSPGNLSFTHRQGNHQFIFKSVIFSMFRFLLGPHTVLIKSFFILDKMSEIYIYICSKRQKSISCPNQEPPPEIKVVCTQKKKFPIYIKLPIKELNIITQSRPVVFSVYQNQLHTSEQFCMSQWLVSFRGVFKHSDALKNYIIKHAAENIKNGLLTKFVWFAQKILTSAHDHCC